MEIFYCTPALLDDVPFLHRCGRIFAENHPNCVNYDFCKATMGGQLAIFIFDKDKQMHVKKSIKPRWNDMLHHYEIVYEVIILRLRENRDPRIDMYVQKLANVKKPLFKHLNLKF